MERDANNEAQRLTILTRSWWMAETEASQRLWLAVMGPGRAVDAAYAYGDSAQPMAFVSPTMVQGFLASLSGAVAGLQPRLPSEAGWEFASRAGTTGAFSLTPSLAAINFWPTVTSAYVALIPPATPRPGPVDVGSLPANPGGLHEVHGNLWELCRDFYRVQYGPPAIDPIGPVGPLLRTRVIRGGAYDSLPSACRSANRFIIDQRGGTAFVGFRLAAPGAPVPGGSG